MIRRAQDYFSARLTPAQNVPDEIELPEDVIDASFGEPARAHSGALGLTQPANSATATMSGCAP